MTLVKSEAKCRLFDADDQGTKVCKASLELNCKKFPKLKRVENFIESRLAYMMKFSF